MTLKSSIEDAGCNIGSSFEKRSCINIFCLCYYPKNSMTQGFWFTITNNNTSTLEKKQTKNIESLKRTIEKIKNNQVFTLLSF